MARRFNFRRVKIHRNYTVSELAELLGAHRQTVRRWIAAKHLPTIDDRRQSLLRGVDVRAFDQARRPIKQRCKPGELYCLRCRSPKRPACDKVEIASYSKTRGAGKGVCPTCEKLMYRAVSRAKVDEIFAGLDISYARAEQRLVDSSLPLANAHSNEDRKS
jgi:excisionase family DNA binding protein